MKKILFSFLLLFALISIKVNGQSKGVSSPSSARCGTMSAFEEMMRDPKQKAIYEENQRIMLQNYANNRAASRTTATIDDTIPCVIHIILANASTVTDATCQSQMDVLTNDYSGLNADSVNIPAAFKPLFGKMKLKFMLAQTDPNGLPTTGIERRNNNITFTQSTYNNAKSFATGGMDNWDPCKYLNFWVVQFSDGLLGISVFPGTGTVAQQGFECDYRCFGTGASYLYAAFNKGRTATHEIGHYLNLRHITGDATCGNDFPGSPTGWDDTPLQSSLTSGCPSGVRTDGCTAAAPGIMYQNYMDYTDDACYCMFTIGQGKRIEQALTSAPDRSCLLTSLAYLPPVVYPNDATVTTILNPLNSSSFCNGTVIPKFTLRNNGSAILSSVKVTVTVDGVAQTPVTLSPNLAANASADITLSSINLATGNHTIIIATSLPNNVADQSTINDSKTTSFAVISSVATPINEGFEGAVFPPSNWVLTQVSGSGNWTRVTTTAKTGTASAKFNNFAFSSGVASSLTTPPLTFASNASTAGLTFHYSHRTYSGEADKLEVFVSSDCGATWTSLWVRSGATGVNALATVAGVQTSAFTPTAAQWTQSPISIDLTAYKTKTIQIRFTATSAYGNNLYLDDINIAGKILPEYDARVASILNPGSAFCELPQTPKVRLVNEGTQTLTSVTVKYTLNGGTPVAQTFTGLNVLFTKDTLLNLTPISSMVSGVYYTMKAYTSLPNNQIDQNVVNDTSAISTIYLTPKTIPFTESFENVFAANNWEILNANNDVTWERFSSPKIVASHLNSVAGIKNYRYTPTGRVDYLVSPLTQFNANDTAIIKFDIAAATYQYPGSSVISLDTLELQFTTDCGANWTTIYKKWGDQLQTLNNPNNSFIDTFYVNNKSQWRTDSVVLGTILANGGYARFRFKNTCFGGNNIFIDNINLYSRILSPNVKQNGYTVSPNPASNIITIQHYLQPAKLRGVGFYNSAGQRVLYHSYNGNADSQLTFNVSSLAAGIYTVKLEYTNKVISEKIIKL